MKQHWYLINISGSRGLLQCEVKEGGRASATAFYYGLRRAFPLDYVTVHEMTKDLTTNKLTTRVIKMPDPIA